MKSGLNLYNAATSFEIECSVEKYIAVARNSEEVSRRCWERFASGRSRAQARKADARVIVVSARRFGGPCILYMRLSWRKEKAKSGLRYQREYIPLVTLHDFPPFLYLSTFSACARIVDASRRDEIRLVLSWECQCRTLSRLHGLSRRFSRENIEITSKHNRAKIRYRGKDKSATNNNESWEYVKNRNKEAVCIRQTR